MSRLLRFRHHAMATVFEVIICEADAEEKYAAQAAQAVFREIDQLEDELSRFRPVSDIWRINNLRAGESATVGAAAIDCLCLAKAVYEETKGAFDITIGPLMRAYFNQDGTPRQPPQQELDFVKSRIGTSLIEIEPVPGKVTVHCDYPLLDLGALGKGYALDQAVEILQQWSVPNALLNAGDSTVLGLGAPPDEKGWIVTVGNEAPQALLLTDRSVSGSGFAVKGAHIMNPRTLRPVAIQRDLVWASAPTAAMSDALSTAFMVMDKPEIREFCMRHPDVEAILG